MSISESPAVAIEGVPRTHSVASPLPRPRILIVQDSCLPGEKCDGPVWAIANMIERLGDRFEFPIVFWIGDCVSFGSRAFQSE